MKMICKRIEIVCSLLLLATMAANVRSAESAQQADSTSIVVEKMHCKGCARKIAAQLYTVPGVKAVSVVMKSKTLVVTAQKGRALSPRLLSEAVEKEKDRVLRIMGAMGTFEQQYAAPPAADTKTTPVTSVVVEKMDSEACAQKVASQMYALPGVTKVEFDMTAKKLFVSSEQATVLSPWALWEAVEKGENHALLISGPHGTLTKIESQAHAGRRPTTQAR